MLTTVSSICSGCELPHRTYGYRATSEDLYQRVHKLASTLLDSRVYREHRYHMRSSFLAFTVGIAKIEQLYSKYVCKMERKL